MSKNTSPFIARFNPYQMDDKTILTLATGRKQLRFAIMQELEEMLQGDGATNHLLLHGPRGMGKSFFSKYLQIVFREDSDFNDCHFILFPEEQSNINFPSDFVRMVLSRLKGGSFADVLTRWEESTEDWRQAYRELEAWCLSQRQQKQHYLLVVLVENVDELLERRFTGIYSGRFREMLEKLPNFVLVATSSRPNIDQDYDKVIYHIFKKYKLKPWIEEDFLAYFQRRRELEEEKTQQTFSSEQVQLWENKLRSISVFTGGFPRMATVLSDLLLKDDLFSSALTLQGLIDDLTPYYQDLVKTIPPKSRQLIDTLIRAGEKLSQTELAKLLGTSQNAISRAFAWLHDNGYVIGYKRQESNSFQYEVSDRIFFLYYKTREVGADQETAPILLLSDLLVAWYGERELSQRALQRLEKGMDRDAIGLAQVALMAKGIPDRFLPRWEKVDEWRYLLEADDRDKVALEIMRPELDRLKERQKEDSPNEGYSLQQDAWDSVGKYLQEPVFHYTALTQVSQQIDVCLEAGDVSLARDLIQRLEEMGRPAHLSGEEMVMSQLMLDCQKQIVAAKSGNEVYDLAQWETLESRFRALPPSFLKQNALLEKRKWFSRRFVRAYVLTGTYGKALDFLQFYLQLLDNEKHLDEKAWILGQMGDNLEELKRYEEALKKHQSALELYKELGDKEEQAWNLGQIGWNLGKLQKHEESLAQHQSALELYKELGVKAKQAWNLELMAWNLGRLQRHEESLALHQSALELYKELGDKEEQAWNLSQIGWNLGRLQRYEESLASHQDALALYVELEDKAQQAWNLGRIGWTQKALGNYEQAIASHQAAANLYEQLNDNESIIWNTGHIGENLILKGNREAAWDLLLNSPYPKAKLLKQYSDAIVFADRHQGRVAAFAVGRWLMEQIAGLDTAEIPVCLSHVFANLIGMQLENALLKDLLEEGRLLYKDSGMTVLFDAVAHTLGYLQSVRNPSYLEPLQPDVALAVAAMAAEVNASSIS